tara:strand:- start:352 stop:498 length:147 start_codon:yes stop_codon:yes gene_type:complete
MKLTKENHEFLDKLFANLMKQTDSDTIDLQEDDSCDDHIQFEKLVNDD